MSNSWYVYRHISPSGKVYVGITSKPKPEIRWANGTGYTGHTYFKKAIIKYGWDNIKHEVVLSGVSKEEAVYTEKYLIRWYKMHNISYNITNGGEGHSCEVSKETREKISNDITGIKRSLDTKRKLARIFSKPVLQLDSSTLNVIAEHPSIKDAAKAIGKTGKENNIAHVLHGRYKTAFGFYWKFK